MNVGIKTYFTFWGIPVTNTVVTTWAIILMVTVFSIIATRKLTIVPGRLQSLLELAVEAMHSLVESSMGPENRGFTPYFLTLGIFLLVANLTGLLAIRPPTADLNTALALSLLTFLMVHYYGIKARGGWNYLKGFFKPMFLLFPLNIISELANPISLSFRLFGNILGGFIIMSLFYSFLPWLAPVIGHLYFDIFAGVIQAFIFIMLSMTFIALAKE